MILWCLAWTLASPRAARAARRATESLLVSCILKKDVGPRIDSPNRRKEGEAKSIRRTEAERQRVTGVKREQKEGGLCRERREEDEKREKKRKCSSE